MQVPHDWIAQFITPEHAIPWVSELNPRVLSASARRYSCPDSTQELVRVNDSSGWYFVLQTPDGRQFWVGKIDGPDHGVRYYGPFDGDARLFAI